MYLDLGEGEMAGAWASFCGGCPTPAVDRGRGSQMESMASCRKMLIEILNYSGFMTVFPSLSSVPELF
jgi:hypothetical protein